MNSEVCAGHTAKPLTAAVEKHGVQLRRRHADNGTVSSSTLAAEGTLLQLQKLLQVSSIESSSDIIQLVASGSIGSLISGSSGSIPSESVASDTAASISSSSSSKLSSTLAEDGLENTTSPLPSRQTSASTGSSSSFNSTRTCVGSSSSSKMLDLGAVLEVAEVLAAFDEAQTHQNEAAARAPAAAHCRSTNSRGVFNLCLSSRRSGTPRNRAEGIAVSNDAPVEPSPRSRQRWQLFKTKLSPATAASAAPAASTPTAGSTTAKTTAFGATAAEARALTATDPDTPSSASSDSSSNSSKGFSLLPRAMRSRKASSSSGSSTSSTLDAASPLAGAAAWTVSTPVQSLSPKLAAPAVAAPAAAAAAVTSRAASECAGPVIAEILLTPQKSVPSSRRLPGKSSNSSSSTAGNGNRAGLKLRHHLSSMFRAPPALQANEL